MISNDVATNKKPRKTCILRGFDVLFKVFCGPDGTRTCLGIAVFTGVSNSNFLFVTESVTDLNPIKVKFFKELFDF